jgi:hypothetical protein
MSSYEKMYSIISKMNDEWIRCILNHLDKMYTQSFRCKVMIYDKKNCFWFMLCK